MIPLILTHNPYAIASFILLTTGSFYICHIIHDRWLSRLNFSLLDANVLIKTIMVIFGFNLIPSQILIHGSFTVNMIYFVIGAHIGLYFIKIESYLIKLQSAKLNTNKKILPLNDEAISIANLSYFSSGLIAICEEILYRGLLTILFFSLFDTNILLFCMFISTVFFALSHLSLGWAHVLSKSLLGLICLLSFISTKTVITPIAIHAVFNVTAIHKIRKLIYEY